MFSNNMPFVRTPKCVAPSPLRKALAAVKEEILMLLGLSLVALTLALMPREYGSPDLRMWCAVLWVQAIPYAAAVLVSFVSAFRWSARLLGDGIERRLYVTGV